MGDFTKRTHDEQKALAGERRAVVSLIIVYWLLFQVVFYIQLAMGEAGRTQTLAEFLLGVARYIVLPAEIAIAGGGGLLCYLMYLALRRIRHMAFRRQLPVATLVTIVGAIAFSFIVRAGLDLFGYQQPPLSLRFLVLDAARWIAPFGLWTAVTLALSHSIEAGERSRRLAEVEARAHETHLRALRYQVNPHFLYNTLNSVAALILDGRNDAAEKMVLQLSEFFRASLAIDPLRDVSLAEEMRLQRLYLGIEQIRFADSLEVDIDVPRDLESAQVPSLILQPLVENALKHGINAPGRKTRVSLVARKGDGRLRIEVFDNGPGTSEHAGTGTGLANVRGRLTARFGSAAAIDASSIPGSGFKVSLVLPLRYA